MKYKRFTQWVVVTMATAAAGLVIADDRHFLQSGRAEPNLIFILDTSSGMSASPEVVGTIWPDCDPYELVIDSDDNGVMDTADPSRCLNGAIGTAGHVPGGGDDPYSRMGIAKRVLRDFLQDVDLANVALAGYAQAQPSDGSNGVPQKHWVYEAMAQDRFHMAEPGYAYRFGYNWTSNGVHVDLPADVYKKALIGYNLYFNPADTEVPERFGPVRGYDTGIRETLVGGAARPLAYDLMPIYFGNCFWDNNHPVAPELVCRDGVFPFYDSGIRDGNDLDPAEWYFGEFGSEDDYPGCDPDDDVWDRDGDGSPDPDACVNTWTVPMEGGVTKYFQRRVRLEIPDTFDGAANHFIEIAADGTRTGNTVVPDGGPEDYDQDTKTKDLDLDGDTANDWMLYVQSVEEQRQIECKPAGEGGNPWTATPTKTVEAICAPLTITGFYLVDSDEHYARINNGTAYVARVAGTRWSWGANQLATAYVDDLGLCRLCSPPNSHPGTSDLYWNDDTGSANATFPYNGTGRFARPLEVYPDSGTGLFVGQYVDPSTGPVYPDIPAGSWRHWWGDIGGVVSGWSGTYDLCMDLTLIGGGYRDEDGNPTDLLCENVCAAINATPTPVPSPTATWTETPFGGPTPTPWFVPSNTPTPSGPVPTSPPLATRTPTPVPTATPTFTPTIRPTNTPIPVATPVG